MVKFGVSSVCQTLQYSRHSLSVKDCITILDTGADPRFEKGGEGTHKKNRKISEINDIHDPLHEGSF